MSRIERGWLCVHGHFSQPPRGNALTGEIGAETDAAPYYNWNERIAATAYRPNAEIGNFSQISYSFSQSLLDWLAHHQPQVYNVVCQNDRQANGVEKLTGHALATAYDHVILPLARKRDKRTQILWGIEAFKRTYNRAPLGFWLPEMAVDTETLETLAEAGIQYTVLSEKQVHGHTSGDAGPYAVELPGGKSIGVFVRHDRLSTELSFNIHNLGGAGRWSRQALSPIRKHLSGLLLLATAGETFGHHFAGEEQFLHWLMTHEALQIGFNVTTLDDYFMRHAPQTKITIEERSSWGTYPGLTEWATGHSDPHQDTIWKGALRRALDNSASEIDHAYETYIRRFKVDPWEMRDSYVLVLSGQEDAIGWLAGRIPNADKDEQKCIHHLLQAQMLTQRMYT
ncbi:MAG: DUF3536 domain-containing protein, partial [Anaerolineae bacterium]|nr:DUF3536 domain-containing protein [Anaerolineae bacterium]